MGRYKVVMCPNCYRFQTIESKVRLNCKLCGKSASLTSRIRPVRIYGSHDDPRDAVKHCQILMRGKQYEGKDKRSP